MRSVSGSPVTALPARRPMALILAAVAPVVWSVAAMAFALTILVRGILVLAVTCPLSLVLMPFVFACGSWSVWNWLCQPTWLLEPGSWLFRHWLRWPWMCWTWLR
jgi:hypothetical protein